MTTYATRALLPAVRHGGALRVALQACACAVVWVASVLLLSAGFVPELDGDESELGIRVTFLVGGVLVAALPVVVLWLPHRRLVTRLVEAVLAVEVDRPAVPPVRTWNGPQRMFQRLRWTAYPLVLVPLLTLLVSALSYGMLLDEDAAAYVSVAFCVVPLVFLVVTATLPSRLVAGVQAGLERDQVVPVHVPRLVEQRAVLSGAVATWFQAVLPDGQQVLLRTPARFAWSSDARGVVGSPDLVLVVGRGGHQGALLVPSRPADAVWLLGPVPQVRVPRSVVRAFGADPGKAGRQP